jgi:hypothetical protein
MIDNINSWIINDFDIITNHFDNNDLLLEQELNLDNNIDIKWKKSNKIYYNTNLFRYDIIPINNIMRFQIKLNKLENLNKFLDHTKIIGFINGVTQSSCSLRSITLLAEKILNLKIIKDNKYFLIPIVLFISEISVYPILRIFINNFISGLDKFVFESQSDINIEKIKNKSISLKIIGDSYSFNDYIKKYYLHFYKNILGLIIWYKSNGTEFLEPNILKVELTLYENNIKFTKEANIEKIKFNNKNGYFISTNKLNFNQIFDYYKTFNSKTFDNFISWNKVYNANDNNNNSIEIHLSNYYDNCSCNIEQLVFDNI